MRPALGCLCPRRLPWDTPATAVAAASSSPIPGAPGPFRVPTPTTTTTTLAAPVLRLPTAPPKSCLLRLGAPAAVVGPGGEVAPGLRRWWGLLPLAHVNVGIALATGPLNDPRLIDAPPWSSVLPLPTKVAIVARLPRVQAIVKLLLQM